MSAPFPSATRTWHTDTYAAINPTRPALSCAGKTIIITGGGSGIGRETALAYAAAGAAHIVLLGRTPATLQATRDALPPSVRCSTHPADIQDGATLARAAAAVGAWDVLVLNAGAIVPPAPIADTDAADWWRPFETNVRGTVVTAKAFLPTAKAHAAVIAVTSAFTVPAPMFPGLSAYIASKTAQAKVLEFLAAEHPRLFVASVQPGFIETAVFTKGGGTTAMDTVQLPAHFMVWLTSPEGAFLRGRTVWANWDVAELSARSKDISAAQDFTVGTFAWDRASKL